MIKYIYRRLIVVITFILLLLAMFILRNYIVNPMLVNAYNTTESTFNNQIKIDTDKYDYKNIIDFNNLNFYSHNVDKVEKISNGITITLNTTGLHSSVNLAGTYFYISSLENNVKYTLSFDLLSTDSAQFKIGLEVTNCLVEVEANTTKRVSCDFTYYSNYRAFIIYKISDNIDNNNQEFTASNLLLNKKDNTNNNDRNITFGYYAEYGLSVNNSTSSNKTININIYNNNSIVTSGTCTIPANTKDKICSKLAYSQGNYTFDSDIKLISGTINNGYLSFTSNLRIRISELEGITLDGVNSGIRLIPFFQATINGAITDTVYFKNTYLFDTIGLSSVNLIDRYNMSDLLFNGILNYTDALKIDSNNDNNVVLANFKSLGYYNSISLNEMFKYNNYLLWSPTIIFNNASIELINMDFYNFSFSSFIVMVNGSDNNVIIPGDSSSNVYEKYNACEAWYDFTCQASNAVTYVVYNMPLISPLLQLLTSMILVIKNIVNMITWYQSIGILFSLFIFILFIRIIIMLLKGSNDDRGNK